MKNNSANNVIEYISLALILSYFFIHNIYLVMIGITLSLYLININFINKISRTINKNSVIKKDFFKLNGNLAKIKTVPINIKSIKDDRKPTLVETIEELGFIPSIDQNDKQNTA